MENEPYLVGIGRAARGAIAIEPRLVQLDEILFKDGGRIASEAAVWGMFTRSATNPAYGCLRWLNGSSHTAQSARDARRRAARPSSARRPRRRARSARPQSLLRSQYEIPRRADDRGGAGEGFRLATVAAANERLLRLVLESAAITNTPVAGRLAGAWHSLG